MSSQQEIPTTGNRTHLVESLKKFLNKGGPGESLILGEEDFCSERKRHSDILGWHKLSTEQQALAPIDNVEYTAVQTSHGTCPLQIFYPASAPKTDRVAMVYIHGGGYTVGTVDDFVFGLRVIAEASGAVVVGVEYRRAPEYKYPSQLDQYDAVIDWLQGEEGKKRGISKVAGSGDSAGGNMTAAIALRRRDEGKKQLDYQVLIYPEARLPFDTKANDENNSRAEGSHLYLEANGIPGFAQNYLPLGVPPSTPYISPGMQSVEFLKDQPPALVFTSGFDPLRDAGVEYAHKLQKARVQVEWTHHPDLTHGFVQFGPFSPECLAATKDLGKKVGKLVYS